MNLKDLNNIDIKDLQNVDWSQAKDRLQSQPDLLINIILVVVTFAVLFSTFNKHTQTTKSSEIEILELQERLDAVEKFETAKTQHSNFLKEAPKSIAGDQLIQTLSEFAIKRNIQILSFLPAKKKNNKLVNLTSVKVNIASENYADIILFVHDIEKSSYPIRIEKWSGSSLGPNETLLRNSRRLSRKAADAATKKKYIKAIITIESVGLNNV